MDIELKWYVSSWQCDIPDVISGQVHPQVDGSFRGSITFWNPVKVLLLDTYEKPEVAAGAVEAYIRLYMKQRDQESSTLA